MNTGGVDGTFDLPPTGCFAVFGPYGGKKTQTMPRSLLTNLHSTQVLGPATHRGSFSSNSSDDQEQSYALSISASLMHKPPNKPLVGASINVIKVASYMTRASSAKSSNKETLCYERKTARQLASDAELNALFVDAKKSGFVLQTSCPDDDQPLDCASDNYSVKALMISARKFNFTDYDLRKARLGHGRGANTSLLKRSKPESNFKLESTF